MADDRVTYRRPGRSVLQGIRAAVTRPRGRSIELVRGLESLGAEVVEAPLIATVPIEENRVLDEAIRLVEGYDWIVLTSATGVEALAAAIDRVGVGGEAVEGVGIACIGPVTAAAAAEVGLRPSLVAEEAVAESLLEALLAELESKSAGREGDRVRGARILLPVAEGARRVLEEGLRAVGAEVDRITSYRTVPETGGLAILLSALRRRRIDLVTFASPSAVEAAVSGGGDEAIELLNGVVVGVIGPITAATARQYGVVVEVEASEYTTAGLLRALVEYYGGGGPRRLQ